MRQKIYKSLLLKLPILIRLDKMIHQYRETSEIEWQSCSIDWYNHCQKLSHFDTRVIDKKSLKDETEKITLEIITKLTKGN